MHQTSTKDALNVNTARGIGTGAGFRGAGAGLAGAKVVGQGKLAGVALALSNVSRIGRHSHHLLTTVTTRFFVDVRLSNMMPAPKRGQVEDVAIHSENRKMGRIPQINESTIAGFSSSSSDFLFANSLTTLKQTA
jgi:hypothetical protein